MPSPPTFGEIHDERLDRDLPNDPLVASAASPGHRTARLCDTGSFWHNGTQYPYTTVISPTLAEDARALLDGDATHIPSNEELLVDVDEVHGINQGHYDAVNPRVPDTTVAHYANNPPITPYVSLAQLQLQPQVPLVPIASSVNNQVQHANATASRQCPYGCPNTFGRPGELRRHMKKHNGPFFPCTRPHCGRMFYRQDKLNDHLNKGH